MISAEPSWSLQACSKDGDAHKLANRGCCLDVPAGLILLAGLSLMLIKVRRYTNSKVMVFCQSTALFVDRILMLPLNNIWNWMSYIISTTDRPLCSSHIEGTLRSCFQQSLLKTSLLLPYQNRHTAHHLFIEKSHSMFICGASDKLSFQGRVGLSEEPVLISLR